MGQYGASAMFSFNVDINLSIRDATKEEVDATGP